MPRQPATNPTGHRTPAYPHDPTIRGRGRSGRPWERAKAHVWREETHCWLCGYAVDQTLHQRDPWSRTADHLHTLDHGGPPLARTNLRLAHRRCNTIRGNKLRNLDRNHCACTLGQPCAPLGPTRPSTLIVDPRSI